MRPLKGEGEGGHEHAADKPTKGSTGSPLTYMQRPSTQGTQACRV